MDLEALRQAEAFFCQWKPELVPVARAFLDRCLERWPETAVVTQKSQVGLRDPRPYCALWPPTHGGFRRRPRDFLVVSLFLPERLDSPRVEAAVEPYPGRWTTHLLLSAPEEVDEELLEWVAQARRFRCGR
ncbi:DUF5655 domain-containing protein [uncultured Oscillibacter sp.]|uniref:DUF5655 domain-containing protein n=1 Tax=uncultured Oscillibacter sp. TaxID=876091 RepID=UPI0025F3FAD6|nr:DUF5655 domain-containing protein [uncultured Oscillibacter sp.]